MNTFYKSALLYEAAEWSKIEPQGIGESNRPTLMYFRKNVWNFIFDCVHDA